MEELRFGVKVIRTYQSAFERQLGESVLINHKLRQGPYLLNSKNDHNRCIIPRLGIDLGKDEITEEYK